jgi:glycosyltransferase involved in cell wall biosynthesis
MGPVPTLGGGVAGVAGVLLRELARQGVDIDVYTGSKLEDIPQPLRDTPGLTFLCSSSAWEWERWYSRIHVSQFVSGHAAGVRSHGRLTRAIVRRHAERPYNYLYHFSQIELFAVRMLRRSLPPIVMHPETHAAGELRWLRAEVTLADRCTPRGRNRAMTAMMAARSVLQRRDIRLADRVIAVSARFATHLHEDYGVEWKKITVVPNPIATPAGAIRTGEASGAPARLLFVSRLAVRKGVEMIVALSHELDDLAGDVEIALVGACSLWSDYSPLLMDLNPRIAQHLGHQGPVEMHELYRDATAILAPSHFEPFGLTVGEALSYGLPVVASDEVGAAAGVDPRVCHVFSAGDQRAFGGAVRRVLELASNDAAARGAVAQAEARRLFDPPTLARHIIRALEAPAC